MKVLIAKEPGLAEFTYVYEKPVPQGNQVLVKVVRNGVCTTDIEILSGRAGFMQDGSTSYPVRFGHEFVGDVVELGPDVKKYALGDRVMSMGYVSCEKCEECKAGNYLFCKDLRAVGTLKTYPGSYAEYVMMPETFLIKLPQDINYDLAALIEPAGVGMLGVKKCNIVPGKSYMLVTGAGSIGIAAAALAKHYGAKKVLISGRTDAKLAVAKQLGVDAVCNARKESLVDFVMRETDGHGVDCLVECSGNISVLNDCVDVLAYGATMAIVAFYEKMFTTFKIDKFIMNNCTLTSVMDHATPEVIQAMTEGLDLRPIITRHVKFDEADTFMNGVLDGRSRDDIKVMVDFD